MKILTLVELFIMPLFKVLGRARTEALFSIGFSNKKVQEQFNSLIIVKSCNIEYKKSVLFRR